MEKVKQKEKEVKEEEFPFIDYEKLLPKLPFDDDGFVKSFDIIIDDDNSKLGSENKREIQEFFDKYGVIVIRNMLTEDELSKTIDEIMDYVEKFHPKFKRNDSTTWDNISGISKNWGIIGDVVMSKQIALNRCNPKIYRAHQYILDNDDIYCNVERVSYMRPTKNVKIEDDFVDKPEWKTTDGKLWLHLDMDPLTNHCAIYGFNPTEYHEKRKIDTYNKVRTQSILSLVDCRLQDGGFQCIPGFHKIHKKWIGDDVDRIKKNIHRHRYIFSNHDPLIKYITKCPIRAGSLLIWDVKLPHNNFPNNSDKPRMVQYIRYTHIDDPAVTFIKFGVENQGPWGMRNPHIVNLDVTNHELGAIGRKVYRVNEQKVQESNKSDSSLPNCNIL